MVNVRHDKSEELRRKADVAQSASDTLSFRAEMGRRILAERQKELLKHILEQKKIKVGDVVSVDFADGEEQCIFQRICCGTQWTGIEIRCRTKKGSWSKQTTYHDADIADHFSFVPVSQRIEVMGDDKESSE